MCDRLTEKGFDVTYFKDRIEDKDIDNNDIVIYALFSRPFRPMGFLDFHSSEAGKVARSLQYGTEKSIVVSFGSPYFGEQYFERALTYVNAYSMLAPSVEAFVECAVGEHAFTKFSPVDISDSRE